MLRAKIDLRQPMFLLKFTEDRDRFRQGSRNTWFPKVPELGPNTTNGDRG
jgi:hypothetical protein